MLRLNKRWLFKYPLSMDYCTLSQQAYPFTGTEITDILHINCLSDTAMSTKINIFPISQTYFQFFFNLPSYTLVTHI